MPQLDGVLVVKIDAAQDEDAFKAVAVLTKEYGIDHLDVAKRSLLLSSADPKFVVLSSTRGRLGKPWHKEGMMTYGTSKAALNYIARAIHLEEPRIVSFPIDPRFVYTDMGQRAAGLLGRAPPQTVEYTAPKLVELVEKATKEETSGNWWML
uniref:Ketoreductase (KR) domain-containing protein n=1 Tax=Kwoniella bestiolae CBS 10118 TaxID=1296100 RepID=A0A1B9G596_9TREE|nr:hypothetical protein I302_03883 [Kwoniella bestiolae CBS 10118]OCF26204.1 hypothetical protein I302_03883 [Kwoniella bestiolae CBS 10118]